MTTRRRQFDLESTFVTFADDGAALPVKFSRKLFRSGEGRMAGVFHARHRDDVHPAMWEVHPAGDEVLYLLSGAMDLILDEPKGERRVRLRAGEACVVPRAVWHRLLLRRPGRLLFITPRSGSELRPVDAAASTPRRAAPRAR